MGGSFFCDAQPLLSPDDILGCGPRPGDEAHEAARVHHPAWRRSGNMAARSARAADPEDAYTRFSESQYAAISNGHFFRCITGAGLDRGTKHIDRAALRGE